MSFGDLDLLLNIYRGQPCLVLPNAYWKTAEAMEDSTLVLDRDSNGELIFFAIRKNTSLLSTWCRKSAKKARQAKGLADIQFALVHNNCLNFYEGFNFSEKKPFFRILHHGKPPSHITPTGFHFQPVDPCENLSQVSKFINQCYQDIAVNEKIVSSWLKHPVYDPKLWIWIIENQTDQFAALGIAEIDKRVPEASLEWIQIHPRYRRRGLGGALVSELLRRVSSVVRFTTVSGEVNNPSNPEKLYRGLGFTGSDIWWMLRTDKIQKP